MIIRVTHAQARAILVSMGNIALAHGGEGVTEADTETIDAAARTVLGLESGATADLTPCPPDALARRWPAMRRTPFKRSGWWP